MSDTTRRRARLRLVPDAKRVIRHAWSLRLIEASFVFTLLAAFFTYRATVNPTIWPFMLAALCEASAWTARLLQQSKISGVDLDG